VPELGSPEPSADTPARRPAAPAIAAAMVVLWTLLMISVCSVKFHYFLYTDFDLAIFAQALFGVFRGEWFSSIRGMYWLGDHSSLGLLLLAPVAALVRHPLLLPVAQALALGLGAWPLFAYARRRLGDERLAAGFAVLWVLQPSLGYLALYEFHPETLAVPALLGAVFFLSSGRTRACLACAALAATTKEDVALPLLVLGAVAMVAPRSARRATGVGLVAIAAASLALTFGVLKPAFNLGEAQYGGLYAAWGRTPLAAAAAMLSHPLRTLGAFVGTPGDPLDTLYKLRYWPELLAPLLGLALLAPLSLLPAMPVIAEHFLASRHEQHTIIYQYTALVLPFVAIATVDGFARIAGVARARAGVPRHAAVLMGVMLATALVAQALYGPLAPPSPLRIARPSERAFPNGRLRALATHRRRFMSELPANGAVVTDFRSLAPLARRDSLYSLHHIVRGTYTSSRRAYPLPRNVRAVLADVTANETLILLDRRGSARLDSFVVAARMRVVNAAGDLLLLAAAPADSLEWLTPAPAETSHVVRYDGSLELLGARLLESEAEPGGLLPVATRWRRVATLPGQPRMECILTDARGRIRSISRHLLGYGLSSVAGWPAGAAFEERYRFIVPAGLADGDYRLTMRMLWRIDDRVELPVTSEQVVPATGGTAPLGSFRVARR